MEECLFCTLAQGETGKLVWENEVAAAFADIHPKAPVHVLVVPKEHITSLDELEDPELAGQLLLAARAVAHELQLHGRWRVTINVGRAGGQVIDHLHLHVLGTRSGSLTDRY